MTLADIKYSGLNDNIIWTPEDNWSVISSSTDIWDGELPYKPGMAFPTRDIENRAMISKTNRLIYNNDVDEIYANIISVFPEIDPNYGWQIREIVTSLPYFKNATNSWVGLVAGEAPIVDTTEDVEVKISKILDNSNFAETIQNEVRSRFIDVISAYRIDIDILGNPTIISIDSKNIVCFVNRNTPNVIEVNVVFSIYTDADGNKLVDFVEYHYDGLIRKHTFYYSDGFIGDYAFPVEEEYAFGGEIKASPIVIFKHNTIGNEIYGTDQYRYWSPSMLAGMRELQNVLRLGERTREILRKVPSSAVRKNPADGSSVFYNKGVISYNEGSDKIPDIEYAVPEIRMDEAIKALNSAIKQIGLDTQLGVVFFNLDSLGSRLSADSIKAAMYPARVEAKRMVTEMKPSVVELVCKLAYLAGLEVDKSKLNITFYDGFPKDEYNDIKAIQMRLESSSPSISLEDAIMKLDHVPLRIAREKAAEIRGSIGYDQNVNIDKITNADDVLTSTDSSNLIPGGGISGTGSKNQSGEYIDDTVWESQMFPRPRDIPQGVQKEVHKNWALRQFRKKV